MLVGLLAFLLLPATAASAHAALIGASPAQDSVVGAAPTQVVLTFTEGVNPIEGKVRIIAPDGSRADAGEPRASGTQLVIPLRSGGGQGTYLVSFRVISTDSHPVSGAFTYSVGAPSVNGPPIDAGNAPSSPWVTSAFPVVRWIGYVGLMLLVGSVLVLALLWPQRLDRAGPIRMIWVGAALVGVATVVELLLQIPYVAGGGLGDIQGSDIREVLSSQYGAAHLIRLGVLGASLLLLRPIVRGQGWGADRVLLAVLGTIAIATWAVSGHPSATVIPMVTVVADMAHLASMSIWLGGLMMLILFLLPRANAAELGAIVPVWSRYATYAIAVLIVTGVAQALVEVGTIDALFSTTYGWLLVAKVGLVLGILGAAMLSRRLVAPMAEESTVDADEGDVEGEDEGDDEEEPEAEPAPSPPSARRLRRYVAIEALVAAAVLGVTSVLVQVTPARTASADGGFGTGAAPTIQSATLRDKLYVLTVDVQPATVGVNEIHLYASTPDGQPATIKEWQVRASLPDQGIEPIDASVLGLSSDHAIGTIGLPTAGRWTFAFTLRTTEVDQATVTTEFTVQ